MAMADAVRQSNGLPSLNLADLEKIKKETSAYNHRFPMPSALNMPAPPLASPSIYSGPPPPYSYPSSTASSVVGANNGNNGYISPPESRRTTEDEKEPAALPRLQSLPSIHEALGNDQHISINSLLSKPAAVSQAPPAPSQRSPTSPISHSRPDLTPLKTSTSFAQGYPSAYRNTDYSEKPTRPRYSPQLPSDIPPHLYPHSSTPQHSKHHIPGTVSSPIHHSGPTASAGHHRQLSPPYEAVSRPPHTMNNQYTYSPYHPSYAYPMPPSSIPSYQPPPPLQQSSWPRSLGSDIDRAEEARKAASKNSPKYQRHGENVKRQLDIFDLETSLNEIADGSGRTLNFTKQYSYQAYQHQRSGPTPSSMPSIEECDEMIKQQNRVLISMERIREVIFKQQQDLAERKKLDQSFNFPKDYDEESLYGDKSEGGGGFAGDAAKKRRGRAAPPGRCHSCNRAETPEWRRGPDGARTLCNACGLHYAKLTRKMGSKTSTGSNLRPKESSPSSP